MIHFIGKSSPWSIFASSSLFRCPKFLKAKMNQTHTTHCLWPSLAKPVSRSEDFIAPMKRSVRPLFSILLLTVSFPSPQTSQCLFPEPLTPVPPLTRSSKTRNPLLTGPDIAAERSDWRGRSCFAGPALGAPRPRVQHRCSWAYWQVTRSTKWVWVWFFLFLLSHVAYFWPSISLKRSKPSTGSKWNGEEITLKEWEDKRRQLEVDAPKSYMKPNIGET